MAAIGTRFGRVILMVRGAEGVSRAVEFYNKAVGLSVARHTDDWAELLCDHGFILNLQAVSKEAQLSVGYSPMLSFEVKDMDSVVVKCTQMGAHLDGTIQYPAHGKVASVRTPDNHILGFYEPSV
mmetsp:Transcript_10340/g.23925  ORF Transcript_10340/g.23925 Transcript_10340/m.23925 type:complete len:125 (+) Transcript_10340:176-550(+)